MHHIVVQSVLKMLCIYMYIEVASLVLRVGTFHVLLIVSGMTDLVNNFDLHLDKQ